MEILFDLADFLPRIPSHLLLHHALNPKAELRFKFPEICHRLANGKTTIDLVEIYCRVPQIFRAEVRKGDNREILLPWRRIAEMLKLSRPPAPLRPLRRTCPEPSAEQLHGKEKSKQAAG